MILQHYDAVINFTSAISAAIVFLFGFGRYRFVLVYGAYSLLNSGLSFVKPGQKARYILFPVTLLALYLDITKGPIMPLFAQNNLLAALPALLITEIVVKHYAQRSIEKASAGRLFIVCPSCNFGNRALVEKCISCSYKNGDQLLHDTSNKVQQRRDIVPAKVFRMLNLAYKEDVVFHTKLFPHKSVIKNGERQIRTNFIITTDNIIFLDHFFFANSWREKDSIPLKTIVSVEGKMEKIFIAQNPFLVINTSSRDVYKIVFKRFGQFKRRIAEIAEIIKSQNPQVEVKINFPE